MKKKLFFGIAILLISIACVVLALIMYNHVLYTVLPTKQEKLLMFGVGMLCVLGDWGIIGGCAIIGNTFDPRR